MTDNRAPEEAGRQDEGDEYESPEIVVLGSVEDLTLAVTGQGPDAGALGSTIVF